MQVISNGKLGLKKIISKSLLEDSDPVWKAAPRSASECCSQWQWIPLTKVHVLQSVKNMPNCNDFYWEGPFKDTHGNQAEVSQKSPPGKRANIFDDDSSFVLRVNIELLVRDIIQKNRGTLQRTWSTNNWGLGVAMGSISTTDNKFLPSSIAQLFLPEQLTTSEQVFWCIIRDKQITRKLLALSSQ